MLCVFQLSIGWNNISNTSFNTFIIFIMEVKQVVRTPWQYSKHPDQDLSLLEDFSLEKPSSEVAHLRGKVEYLNELYMATKQQNDESTGVITTLRDELEALRESANIQI